MLVLLINDRPVHLNSDFSFTMNGKNPMFNEIGSYSFPFKIPNTPLNSFITKYIDRIPGTTSPYTDFTAEVIMDGVTLYRGTAKFRVLKDDSLEGTVYDREGDFNYQRKNKQLRNFNYGDRYFGTEVDGLKFANECFNTIYPERDVCFPMLRAESLFDPATTDPDQMFINQYVDGKLRAKTEIENNSVIVPMIYLKHVLAKLFEQMGYTYVDNFFNKKRHFYNLAIFNQTPWNKQLPDFNYDMSRLYYNMHLPKMSVNDFLTGVEDFFNMRFFVDNKSQKIYSAGTKDVISGSSIVDWSGNVISMHTEAEDQVKGCHLKMSLDGSDKAFEQFWQDEENYASDMRDGVEKFSDLPVWPYADFNEIRYVNENGYHCRLKPTGWELFDYAGVMIASHKFYGKFSDSIDIKFSTVKNQQVGDQSYAHVGNSLADWNDIAPRFLFCSHNSANEAMYGSDYLAFSDDRMYLWFNGPFRAGLFDLFHKSTWDFKMNTRLVKMVKKMSLSEAVSMDFRNKVLVHNVPYLVKTYQLTCKMSEVDPVSFELYKCT